MKDLPLDIFRLVIDRAFEVCTDAEERIQLQNSLMCVDRTFCRFIIESPFVPMVDALQCRNPLAANVALRYLARQEDAYERLLKIPQIVGAALVIRINNYGLYGDPYLVYMFKLGRLIKNRLTSTFYDDRSVPRNLDALMECAVNDDFTKLAQIILTRRVHPMAVHKVFLDLPDSSPNCKITLGMIELTLPKWLRRYHIPGFNLTNFLHIV